MEHKPGELCQVWRFSRCVSPSHTPFPAADKLGDVVSARGTSPSATTETLTVTEEHDAVVTTRTTSTTVITVVTEITRTPKTRFYRGTAGAGAPQRRSIGYR